MLLVIGSYIWVWQSLGQKSSRLWNELMEAKINELLILTDDQIDYQSLPEDTLKQLALNDELFIATSALTELSIRNSPCAASVAWEILSQAHGDHHLQARAVEVLFEVNRKQAMDWIEQQVPECEPFMLNAIMELIIENESDFKFDPGLSITHLVIERLAEFDEETRASHLEVKSSFLKHFGYLRNWIRRQRSPFGSI